jgi:hypothetical protein
MSRVLATGIVAGIVAIIVALVQFVIGPCYLAQMRRESAPTPTANETAADATTRIPVVTVPRPDRTSPSAVRVGSWIVSTLPIEDDQGHKGLVEVFILSNEYSWGCNSSEVVGIGGKVADIGEHLQATPMQERLRTKHALVAVGASSHEGRDREEQERLALRRSRQLVLWLRNNISGELPTLYALSLGQHTFEGGTPEPCSGASESERPVVILGLVSEEPNFSVSTALSKVFVEPDFPLSRGNYSRFVISRQS